MFAAVRDTPTDATWVRGTHPGRGTTRQAGRGARDLYMTAAHTPGDHRHSPGGTRQLMRVPQPAASSVLSEVRLAATGDLLNVAKRYSLGRTWSNFTRLLLMQPSWGRILPLGLPLPGQLLAGSVFEVVYLSWGGAKRARTADLLHAMNHRRVRRQRHTVRQLRKR